MDSVQRPSYLEVLLSPRCTILQVYMFVVGWISFERLDMNVDMNKNRIIDGPKSSLHFLKQLLIKHEGVTLK